MDPPRYRTVVEYILKQGLKSKRIHEELVNTYGGHSPHIATVKTWVLEFKRRQKSLEDDDRGRGPFTGFYARNGLQSARFSNTRQENNYQAARSIAQAVGKSQHTVCHILKNELHTNTVSARWAPRLLTPEQKYLSLSLKQHK